MAGLRIRYNGVELAYRTFDTLEVARPPRTVCLSTIGAQATETNLLTQRTLMEQALRALMLPVTLLRPAWFTGNFA